MPPPNAQPQDPHPTPSTPTSVVRPLLVHLQSLVFQPDSPPPFTPSTQDLLTTFAACECAARAFSRRSIDRSAAATHGPPSALAPAVISPTNLRTRAPWHRVLIDAQQGRHLALRRAATEWLAAFSTQLPIADASPWPRALAAAQLKLRTWAASTLGSWTAHAETAKVGEPAWPTDWQSLLRAEQSLLRSAAQVAADLIAKEHPGPEPLRALTQSLRQLAWSATLAPLDTPAPTLGPALLRLEDLEEAIDWLTLAEPDSPLLKLALKLRPGRCEAAAAEFRILDCFATADTPTPTPPAPVANSQPTPRLSPPTPIRPPLPTFAVIDIGSNAVRLLACSIDSSGSRRTLAEGRVQTGLGQGMSRGTGLAESTVLETVRVVERFAERAKSLDCSRIGVFATAAVREAANATSLTDLIFDRTGLRVEVLSSRDEGLMAFRGAGQHDSADESQALADIGGGSAQIVLARRGVIISTISLPLGAVRLTEQFGPIEAGDDASYEKLVAIVDQTIDDAIPGWWTPTETMIGCGGGFTTCSALESAASPSSIPIAHLNRSVVQRWITRLLATSPSARASIPGLPGDRARIAVAGLCVADRIMHRLGCTSAQLSYSGVRGGLLERLAADPSTADPRIAADQLAKRCGDERPHALHVAALAVSIWDQLAAVGSVPNEPAERQLLEVAASVHDVGLLASYGKHHKWGREIILNQPLAGLSSRENGLVAQLVRYHRKSGPKAKHKAYANLQEADAAIVLRLAGILRVADGLDRTHDQVVKTVRVDHRDEGYLVEVTARGDCRECLDAASTKADVLAEALGAAVMVKRGHPA